MPADTSWVGHRLDDVAGAKVGRIAAVIAAEDGSPRWLCAKLGRFGSSVAVPAGDAVEGAGCIWVPYAGDLIRAAPRIEDRTQLEPELDAAARTHFGVG